MYLCMHAYTPHTPFHSPTLTTTPIPPPFPPPKNEQEALQVHPDRTSEPGAKARFQQLSEAYQVLSTPALRAAYDKEGDAVRGCI